MNAEHAHNQLANWNSSKLQSANLIKLAAPQRA